MNKNKLDGYLLFRNLSREALAEGLGIEYVSLSRKLNGHNEFKLDEVKKVKQLLNLSNEQLFEVFFDE